MSAKYRISRTQSGQYDVVKNGEPSSTLTASGLRQLCQTMGEPYAHLMAKLQTSDVVELTVAYGKVQRPSVDASGSDR